MNTWVWIDGGVVPASEAEISATDRGLLLGDGVYETLTVIDGEPFALTRHLARLRATSESIGLPVPWADSHLRSACAKTVGAAMADASSAAAQGASPSTGRLRITVTGGAGPLGPRRGALDPTLMVMVGPDVERGPTVDVVLSPWVMNERSPVAGIKTTSQIEHVVALEEATRRGAGEAVLVNSRGILAEGTGSNLFLVVAGRLSTPALTTGCLPGITRGLICETVEVVEREDLTIDDLRMAAEAFLTSSTRGIHPVARVDGHPLRSVPGPLTTSAMAAFQALRSRTIDP